MILASSRPFDLDIHEIPARKDQPAHYHYDVRYVFIAPEGAVFVQSHESKELRWFTVEEMEQLSLDAGLQRLATKWQALRTRRAH